MKRPYLGNFRALALFMAVLFGVTMIAGTALSRDWHPQQCRSYPHSRVVVRGSTASAIIATGIVAGITFSLLSSAANAPAPRYTATYQPVYNTGSTVSYAAAAGSVTVTAPMLNIRSGPGLENPSVRQIPVGTVLSVQGNAPGWYYVKTQDNLYGWVMTQYTAPAGYPAAG